MSINRATARDAEVLTELSVSTFRDSFAAQNEQENMDMYIAEAMSLEKLAAELNDTKNIFFIAWDGNTAAGYSKIRPGYESQELSNNNPLEIERIYVAEQYQGQKVGAALMAHCLDYAVQNNYDIVWLGVWEHNHKAIDFYTKWGFHIFSSHIFRLGHDDQTDILMKKHLVL